MCSCEQTRLSFEKPNPARHLFFGLLSMLSITGERLSAQTIALQPLTTPTGEAARIDAHLDSIQVPVLRPAREEPVGSPGPQQVSGQGDSRITCSDQAFRKQGSLSSLAGFSPNAQTLWPGSLVQGASLSSNRLMPAPLPRGPIRLTITEYAPGVTAENRPETVTRILQDPNLGSVTDTIFDLVFPNPGTEQPASVAVTAYSFYSAESGAIALQTDLSSVGTSVSASLSNRNYRTESNVVVQVVQKYYTVTVSPFQYPSAALAPNVSLSAVQAMTAPRDGNPNPLAYVSSVSYGRIAYIFLSSSEASEKLRVAAQATYNGLYANAGVKASAEEERIVNSARKEVFVLGGAASNAVELNTNNSDGLQNWLRAGATFSRRSPGLPISFTMRFLNTAQTDAGMAFSTDYTRPICTNSPERIVSVHRLYHLTDNKDRGTDHIFQMLRGPEVIAEENWTGGDIVWHPNVPSGYPGMVTIMPDRSVRLGECSGLTFRTTFRNGSGDIAGRVWVRIITNDGRSYDIVNGQEFNMNHNASRDWRTSCPPAR